MLEAVRRAGVPQLVVASSVGAYSPAPDDGARTEEWATDGVRSSSYSVDKAAVERMLDEAAIRLPSLSIARLRPALIFQRAAGREVGRYFFGPFLPERALAHLPVLPWPAGLRLQVVHAEEPGALEAALWSSQPAMTVAEPAKFHLSNRKRETLDFAIDHLVRQADLAGDVAVSDAQRLLAGALRERRGSHERFAPPALQAETPSTEALLAERRRAYVLERDLRRQYDELEGYARRLGERLVLAEGRG